MTRIITKCALALSVVAFASTPALAQWADFAPVVVDQNGDPFWDNNSDDGAGGELCNIGAIFKKITGTCNNQRPAGWLPYTGADMDEYDMTAGFDLFNSNPLGAQFTLYGDIAGENREWGIFNGANSNDRVNLNGAFGAGAVPNMKTGSELGAGGWSSFGFYIQDTDNVYRFSNSSEQFALFRNDDGLYGVGLEDIFVGQRFDQGDRDYNDVVLTFSLSEPFIVPEPSSVFLAISGLVMMGAAARRRRSNA